MTLAYIISDNQFFALGAAALIKQKNAVIISPEEILNQETCISSGVCYVFIHNRRLHRRVCGYLKQTTVSLIFFLPGIKYCRGAGLLSCFWSARMTVRCFRARSAHVARYLCRFHPESITPARRKRIHMVAGGMEQYLRWVNSRSISPKITHSHHRVLIKAVGIENVSVHTLFLSEYIAAGQMAIL